MISIIDRLRDATLVHRASGAHHDNLAKKLQIVRPPGMARSQWRDVLSILGYGFRGRPAGTRDAVTAALRNREVVLTVEIDPAYPTRVASASSAFTQALVGRDVEIEGVLYRVDGPQDVTASAGAHLFLSPYHTSTWSRCAWTGAARSAVARFRAFRVVEEGGLYRVFVAPGFDDVPPTYWCDDNEDRPEGEPEGGFVMEDATDLGDDTFPLYMPGTGNEIGEALSGTLPAGWHVVLEDDWQLATAPGEELE